MKTIEIGAILPKNCFSTIIDPTFEEIIKEEKKII